MRSIAGAGAGWVAVMGMVGCSLSGVAWAATESQTASVLIIIPERQAQPQAAAPSPQLGIQVGDPFEPGEGTLTKTLRYDGGTPTLLYTYTDAH